MQSSLSTDQLRSLIEETETAITLLDEGIRVIAAWDGGEDQRIRGLFSTSQGFERLLKLTMTLILYGEGEQPSSKVFKKQYGHRLLGLLDDVLDMVRADSGAMRSQALRDDIDFCASNQHLREMFDILGEFGDGGRYYNLNVLLDSQSQTDDPMQRWYALETSIYSEDPSWHALAESDPGLWGQRWYPYLASKQVGALQRAARFLVRLWILGPAQQHGKKLKGPLRRFLNLRDRDLGSVPD